MSHEQTRQRVLESLFASTGNSEPHPARRHLTDEQFTDLAVRWMWAVVRDREEHGPLVHVNTPRS